MVGGDVGAAAGDAGELAPDAAGLDADAAGLDADPDAVEPASEADDASAAEDSDEEDSDADTSDAVEASFIPLSRPNQNVAPRTRIPIIVASNMCAVLSMITITLFFRKRLDSNALPILSLNFGSFVDR